MVRRTTRKAGNQAFSQIVAGCSTRPMLKQRRSPSGHDAPTMISAIRSKNTNRAYFFLESSWCPLMHRNRASRLRRGASSWSRGWYRSKHPREHTVINRSKLPPARTAHISRESMCCAKARRLAMGDVTQHRLAKEKTIFARTQIPNLWARDFEIKENFKKFGNQRFSRKQTAIPWSSRRYKAYRPGTTPYAMCLVVSAPRQTCGGWFLTRAWGIIFNAPRRRQLR